MLIISLMPMIFHLLISSSSCSAIILAWFDNVKKLYVASHSSVVFWLPYPLFLVNRLLPQAGSVRVVFYVEIHEATLPHLMLVSVRRYFISCYL